MRTFVLAPLVALLLCSPSWAQKVDDDEKIGADPNEKLGDDFADAPPEKVSGEVSLDIDSGALLAEQRCVGMISAGRDVEAKTCLQGVIERAPESTAAIRAAASLEALSASRAARLSTGFAAAPPAFPPGRLQLVLASGLFGIFNGTAPAMLLGAQSNVPGFFSAAGGGGAVLLGGSFALGSYLLSEVIDPTPGTSVLLASGMAWGVGLGVALSPWVFSAVGSPWQDGSVVPPFDFERGFPAATAASAITGYIGLAVAGGLALALDFDEGQVGTMNTGAAVGLVAGLAVTPIFSALQLANPGVLGLAFATGGALGLVGGLGMGRAIKLDVWEVLVIDLVTGVSAAGSGAAAFLLSQSTTGPEGGLLGSAVVIFGTGAALLASTGALGWLRVQRGELFSRVGLIPIDLIFGAPEVVLDRGGALVPLMPLVAGRF